MEAMVILNYLHCWDTYVLLPLAFIDLQAGDTSGAWGHWDLSSYRVTSCQKGTSQHISLRQSPTELTQ